MALISVQVPSESKSVLPDLSQLLERVRAGQAPATVAERGAPTAVVQPTTETTPVTAATEDTSEQPDWYWFLAAVVLLIVGVVVGVGFSAATPVVVRLSSDISATAVFFLIAQAIERAAEFFTYIPWIGASIGATRGVGTSIGATQGKKTWIGKQTAVNQRNNAIAASITPLEPEQRADKVAKQPAQADKNAKQPAQQAVQQAAEQHDLVSKIRTNRTVFLWALNSFLAMLACGWLHLSLFTYIGVAGASNWLDIAITGLAVGGGTKPLHDLITNLQKAKEEKEDPKQVEA